MREGSIRFPLRYLLWAIEVDSSVAGLRWPRDPPPWRFAPVPPPNCRGGTGARFARGCSGACFEQRRDPLAAATLHLFACHQAAASPQLVVREGGLRVVVAANL